MATQLPVQTIASVSDIWLLRDDDETESKNNDELYKSAALDREDASKIRILHMAPADNIEAPLDLSFSIVSLIGDQEPEYVALSYTWQSSESSSEDDEVHEVTFSNRYRAQITHNLLLALRTLRHNGYRTLWVDQLSINQQDLAERGDQVSIMAAIFSKASKVVVYLGPETDVAHQALGSLQEVSVFIERCRELEAEGSDPRVVPSLKLPRRVLEAWLGIYDYSWFKRVWVVQETLLAREASIAVGLREYDAAPLRQSYHLLSSGVDNLLKTELNRNQDVFRRRSTTLSAWGWLTRAHHQQQSKALYSKSLEALDWMRTFGATDMRDRIFAMLGPLRLDVVPDYKASISTVYTRFAAGQVKSSDERAFEVIEAAGMHNQERGGLPSWVPDWTARRRYRISLAQSAHERFPRVGDFIHSVRQRVSQQIDSIVHNATAGTLFLDATQASMQRFRVSFTNSELALKGAMIGTVSSLTPSLTKVPDDNTHVRNVLDWHRTVRSFAFTTHSARHPDAVERVYGAIRLLTIAYFLVNSQLETTATIPSYLHDLSLLQRIHDAAGGD